MKSYNMSSEDDKAWDDPVAVGEQRKILDAIVRKYREWAAVYTHTNYTETLREYWENPTHKVEMEMMNQVKGEVLEHSDFKCTHDSTDMVARWFEGSRASNEGHLIGFAEVEGKALIVLINHLSHSSVPSITCPKDLQIPSTRTTM